MDWTYESEKRISIKFFDEGELKELTSNDLIAGSFSFTERLCSLDQLEFGSCEASEVRFTVGNPNVRLKGKEISVALYNADTPNEKYDVGTFIVVSDKAIENRTKREVVAYDEMYQLSQVDVSDWYNNSAFSSGDSTLIGSFVESFFRYISKPYTFQGGFPWLYVYKQPRTMKGLMATDIMRAIGEVFGGAFRRVHNGGVYKFIPYAQRPRGFAIPTKDILNLEYEEFTVKPVSRVVVQSGNGAAYSYGNGNNVYTLQDSLLFTEEGLKASGEFWAQQIYQNVRGISYVPFSGEVVGNLEMELGDAVSFALSDDTYVTSIILERTLNGIQGMTDSLIARGQEDREYDTGIAGQVSNISKRTADLENEISDIVHGKLHAEENLDLSAGDAVVIKGNDGIYLDSNVYTNKDFIDFESDVFVSGNEEISGQLNVDLIKPYSSQFNAGLSIESNNENASLTLDSDETELSNTEGSLRLNGEGGVEINSDSGVVRVTANDDNLWLEGDAGVRIVSEGDTVELEGEGGVLANGYEVGREIETIELKMLGWNVPRECPIQNRKVYPNKFRQLLNRVQFNTLSWNRHTSGMFFAIVSGISQSNVASTDNKSQGYVNGYTLTTLSVVTVGNKRFAISKVNSTNWGIYINDTAYSDVNSFLSAHGNDYFYYELATPIETVIDGNEVADVLLKENLSALNWRAYSDIVVALNANASMFAKAGNYTLNARLNGGAPYFVSFGHDGSMGCGLVVGYFNKAVTTISYSNGTFAYI